MRKRIVKILVGTGLATVIIGLGSGMWVEGLIFSLLLTIGLTIIIKKKQSTGKK